MKKIRFLFCLLTALLLPALLCARVQAHERLGDVEFKAAAVGDAARVLSEMSKKHNIVVTEAARARQVSLFLKNASVESAVDALCRATGLWYRRDPDHGAYYIMTEEEFSKEIVVAKESITRVFELKHQNVADASHAIESLFGNRVRLSEPKENASYRLDGDIAQGLGGQGRGQGNSRSQNGRNQNAQNNAQGGASAQSDTVEARRDFFTDKDLAEGQGAVAVSEAELVRSRVRAEPPIYLTWNYLHNLLLLRTSDRQAVSDIEALVQRIDRPAQQVLLEVQILRAKLGDEERSIFDYSFSKGQVQTGSDDSGNPVHAAETLLNLGRFPLEGGAFLAQVTGSELTATIEWLRSENRLNLVSQPNILAANNKEATLRIGEERVMVTGASANTITNENSAQTFVSFDTEKKNIGTLLSIWPRINGDQTVTLDITQLNTSLNEGSTSLPVASNGNITNVRIDSITESGINLTAVARHGATIAVGGMIESEQQNLHEKTPLLGDIPLLGKLFRKDYQNDSRSELIVLITPWIFNEPASAQDLNQQRVRQWSESDELEQHLSQAETATAASEAGKTSLLWPPALQKAAVDAIRAALGAASAEDETLHCPAGTRVLAARFNNWQLSRSLRVDATAHCLSSDGAGAELYLTLAQVSNLSAHQQPLSPRLFNQGWMASSGESATLPPGGSRPIYLVSTQAPERLLQQQQLSFFYTENAIDEDAIDEQ